MKYIDIFLASSSIDMHSERMELGNYIRSLNNLFLAKGIYCRLHMCEDISDEIAKTRKQDEYNGLIRKSDYFFVMFWHSADANTIRCFDVALERFRESGAPKISTFFKRTDGPPEAEVAAFIKRLKNEIKHYYTVFDEIDTIKLKILLMLAADPEALFKVEFKDAEVLIDGEKLDSVDLEKLPLYVNHEAIKELRIQLQGLEKEFIEARLAVAADASDDEAMQKLLEVSARKNKVSEQLHKYEMELIEAASNIIARTESGEYLTERAQRAIELFDQGKVKEAQAILDDEQRKMDAANRLESGDENDKEIKAIVKEVLIKIDTYKAQGVTGRTAEDIIKLYEEAESYIISRRLDRECLIDYVGFLRNQDQYSTAVGKAEKLYYYFKSLDEPDEWNIGRVANNLAILYNHIPARFQKAQELYKESLSIYCKLSKKNPFLYRFELAAICNNLANLCYKINSLEESEKFYKESLSIWKKLAKNNPSIYESYFADICNNLAGLYYKTNRSKEAEILYKDSLSIYRRLAEANPSAYKIKVSISCNNLAILYSDINFKEAEELYKEALLIQQMLSKNNPFAYEKYVAETCNNLAYFYSNTNCLDKAEGLYKEALSIYHRLAERNPSVYEPKVASTCYNLAEFYFICREEEPSEELEKLYKEALSIYCRLAEKNPSAYEFSVAETCGNLANLYTAADYWEKAEALYRKALFICRRLSKDNPFVYELKAAEACQNLAIFYYLTGRLEEADKLYKEASSIRCRQVEKGPNAEEYVEMISNELINI